jgi:hypothetical protein
VQFLRAKKSFGSAGTLPSRKNHSLFATHRLLSTAHHPLPFYQSLIAAVSRLADLPISRFTDKFGSAGASPSQFIPSPVPRPTTRSVSVPCPVPMVTNLFGEGGEGDANEGA